MASEPVPPPEGEIQLFECSKCGVEKPRTREFFSPNGTPSGTLRRACKVCCAVQTAKWKAANPKALAAQIQRQKEFAEQNRWRQSEEDRYPLRRCTNCRVAKPNNPGHFPRGKGPGGLNSWCKDCFSNDHLANRAKRNAKVSENYYAKRAKDPTPFLEQRRRWRDGNREAYRDMMRAAKAKRRAQIIDAGGSYSAKDVAAILIAQKRRCWWCSCKLTTYHVDHRIPLAKGGTNGPENIVASCGPCNQKKNAKMPWETETPRLL